MDILKRYKRILSVLIMLTMVISLSVTDVHAASSSSIKLQSYTAPTTVSMGHPYVLKGKIKAGKKIYKVEIGVVSRSNGKWMYKYSKSKINSKTFNIKKADTTIKFGNLKEGAYYYRINVQLKGNKTKTVLNKTFNVIDNSAESVGVGQSESTGISLSGCNAPGTFNAGKEFLAKGVVTSTSKIKKVEVGIVFAPTNKWTEYKYTANVNSNTFDLSKVAQTLRFDRLPGGTYRYRMYAHTEDGVKIVFNKLFEVKPSNKAQMAVNWAVNIANNNSFSYGKKPQTSKVGCYFCGTNQKRKPAGYEKTYVCMTFIHAAYAHGAGDPELLKDCQKGSHCLSETETNFTRYSCWFKVGLCKDLKVEDLLPGDVICYYSANNVSGHLCMYIGDNNIVDSEGIADCWGPNSIAVRNKAAKMLANAAKFSSKSYVMRYRG